MMHAALVGLCAILVFSISAIDAKQCRPGQELWRQRAFLDGTTENYVVLSSQTSPPFRTTTKGVDLSTGEIVWSRSDDSGRRPESPCPLSRDRIIASRPSSFPVVIEAFNAANGSTIWETAIPGRGRFSFASVTCSDDFPWVVVQGNRFVVLRKKDGKVLWNAKNDESGDLLSVSKDAIVTRTATSVISWIPSSGTKRWVRPISRASIVSPVGDALLVEQNRTVLKLNNGNGRTAWKIRATFREATFETELALYLTLSNSKKLASVNPKTGKVNWSRKVGDLRTSVIDVSGDLTLTEPFFLLGPGSAEPESLTRIDRRTGRKLFTFRLPPGATVPAIQGSQGQDFLSFDNLLRRITPTGRVLWEFEENNIKLPPRGSLSERWFLGGGDRQYVYFTFAELGSRIDDQRLLALNRRTGKKLFEFSPKDLPGTSVFGSQISLERVTQNSVVVDTGNFVLALRKSCPRV